MKKTYIQPSTQEVMIATQTLLAGSDPAPKFDPNEETDGMDSRRRGRNVWNDEEEEEY